MADMRHLTQGLPPGMVPVQVPRPPSDAERAEVERVRGMQVRKDAVTLAVEHHRGTGDDRAELLRTAQDVAAFILGEGGAT